MTENVIEKASEKKANAQQISTMMEYLKDQGYEITKKGTGSDVYPKVVYKDGTSLLSIMEEDGSFWEHDKYTDIDSALTGVNRKFADLNEEIELENIERTKKKQAPLPLYGLLKELQILDLRKENK